MPLTITFPVFFTLSYVMVLMVKDAEKSLQLLQLFISKKTEKRIIINTSIQMLCIIGYAGLCNHLTSQEYSIAVYFSPSTHPANHNPYA